MYIIGTCMYYLFVSFLGANTVNTSFSKLKDAEKQLKEIVKQKLSHAVFHKDKHEVERSVIDILPLSLLPTL